MLLGLPALGDDGDRPASPAPDRIAPDGSVIPEQEDNGPVTTLEEVYRLVNPSGAPGTYVCDNPGDENVEVVYEHRVSPDRRPDPAAAPPTSPDELLYAVAGPCAGKAEVVGR